MPNIMTDCCNAPISYLKDCDDCIEEDRECKLSTNGVCSNCGDWIE